MTKRFTNYQAFANHLKKVQRQIPLSIKGMLLLFCEVVEKDLTKNIIGRTMPLGQVGAFRPWPPLQEDTIKEKMRLGLGKNGNPKSFLYATGALHDSFEHTIQHNKAVVGTDIPYAAVQEYGSPMRGIPARPFIGPASIRAMEKLQKIYQKILDDTLEGKPPFRVRP